MSTFGKNYRVTTFGESHCDSVGVIIDGVIPQFKLSLEKAGKRFLTKFNQ